MKVQRAGFPRFRLAHAGGAPHHSPVMASAHPVEDFIRHTVTSITDNTFVRLVFSGGSGDASAPKRMLARLIKLRGAPHLSLTLRHATRDVTQNLPVGEVAGWLRLQLTGHFRSALLGTTVREWQLNFPPDKEPWLISHKPHTRTAPARDHDEARQTWLDASARDWLHGLGVCDAHGRVNPSMADKHRQMQRYLDILSHLARDCGWAPDAAKGVPEAQPVRRVWVEGEAPAETGPAVTPAHLPDVPVAAELTLADMGCGKGYLTFGAWHLFRRRWRIPVRVVGVEARPDLVKTTSQLARKIDAPGLEFVGGDIATAELPRVDALIALHACNTATDDAIRRGLELGAKLIVVAPCCHKEVRPQLGRPAPLAPVLEHGIMAERMAEWVTDGLRALFLEWAGYRTKLMEFVASEHTPKNLMLAAMRERAPFTNPAAREQIVALKKFFGIERHALDPLLEKTPGAEGPK
ncbi:MAG TPA: SAM-dependent methyltransferase [Verrucomicrobiae bacterium]|nr:SAM-dependent methyltransferase [Verrucomicrobiae bacterium]